MKTAEQVFVTATAAIKTLRHLGYAYHGAELWKPPLGDPAPKQVPIPASKMQSIVDAAIDKDFAGIDEIPLAGYLISFCRAIESYHGIKEQS